MLAVVVVELDVVVVELVVVVVVLAEKHVIVVIKSLCSVWYFVLFYGHPIIIDILPYVPFTYRIVASTNTCYY